MADDDLPDVPALRMLEPPRDGLERLRTRLASPARWPYAIVAAVAAVVLAWIIVGRDPSAREPSFAVRGALPDPSVAPNFYWVTSRPAGPDTALPAPAEISISEAPQVQAFQP